MDKFIYRKSAGITALSASFSDFKYKKHSHKEYAFGVTLRGIQQYSMKGGFQSSHKNGVMVFNAEQTHDGMAGDKSGIDYIMLYIEPNQLLELLETKNLPIFSSPITYDKALQEKIEKVAKAVLTDKDETICNELLVSFADHIRPEITENYRTDHSMADKAKEIICGDLKHVLSLDEVCKELSISKYQFIRLFKSSTGISPYQYYLNSKVEKAKQVIESTEDVYSAVESCGFADLTHLNKQFKAIYGVTAFEYLSNINKSKR